MHMDDDKLADAITNLEIACFQIRKLENHAGIDPDSMELLVDVVGRMKDSIQILRGFEIRNEIESFSGEEDEV